MRISEATNGALWEIYAIRHVVCSSQSKYSIIVAIINQRVPEYEKAWD